MVARRVSRRPPAGAVARVGHSAEGYWRPALVSSLSGRGDQARRRAALDQAEPELEFHVRGVPFDRRAQELRRGDRPLRDELRGNQRGLRGVSWTGVSARRLGPGAAKLVACPSSEISGQEA